MPDSLRTFRARMGLTQTELAERVGLRAATISMVESGVRGVSVAVLHRLAEELRLSSDERAQLLADLAGVQTTQAPPTAIAGEPT